jgi:hypothetical protein
MVADMTSIANVTPNIEPSRDDERQDHQEQHRTISATSANAIGSTTRAGERDAVAPSPMALHRNVRQSRGPSTQAHAKVVEARKLKRHFSQWSWKGRNQQTRARLQSKNRKSSGSSVGNTASSKSLLSSWPAWRAQQAAAGNSAMRVRRGTHRSRRTAAATQSAFARARHRRRRAQCRASLRRNA